ncbi:hypothetical protein LCGC14_0412620 [marine sediment metagenome]|uniref:Uncharacterized protein n=1 Tax=marine sediment metagenome TaxID=412755 RepID=A0A0F9VFH8_9ZZZZ
MTPEIKEVEMVEPISLAIIPRRSVPVGIRGIVQSAYIFGGDRNGILSTGKLKERIDDMLVNVEDLRHLLLEAGDVGYVWIEDLPQEDGE